MTIKNSLTLLILSASIVGCSNISAPASVNTPPVVEPSLLAITPPPNTLPTSSLVRKCLDNLEPSLTNKNIPGVLILSSPTFSGNYFLDMSTGTKKSITQNESDLTLDFSVAPNGDWLAYISGGESGLTESLIVQSAYGQKSFKYPVNRKEWQSIAYWLNNETLVLWNHNNPLDSLILFNPFTGEKRTPRNDYPNILPEDSGWDQFWPSITTYNSSLKQVVYLGNDKNGYQPGNATLVLWDITKNQQIATVEEFGYTLLRPIWKLDNSGLVFVKAVPGSHPLIAQDEWFLLNSSGKIKQLTKLTGLYQSPRIYSASLSPDGHFLAFELVTNLNQKATGIIDRRVLILDMVTSEITDYCLISEAFAHLTWSPNSRYLAFSQVLSGDDFQTVVLDVLDKHGIVVAEHLRPEGWLNPQK